ncbi:hypothetical protein [Kitasatospora viridis]|uniref:hypothetical protein n=1 Tax=Kitasatospora viridis TaxID=281105 RepID=UPI00119F66E3|nr:hypothetical protein [Kitasatospora viridis]
MRITWWLTVGQLTVWTAVMIGFVALYVWIARQTYAPGAGAGALAGLIWLVMMLPAAAFGVAQLIAWSAALTSWRRGRTDAADRIRVAAVLTCAAPVLLALTPGWMLPHQLYAVAGAAALAALGLAAARTVRHPDALARLTAPPRKPRKPLPDWLAPTRHD